VFQPTVRASRGPRLNTALGLRKKWHSIFFLKTQRSLHERRLATRQARSAVSFAQFSVAKERL